MDAFEQLMAELLWREGHWVKTAYKVDLTKAEKRQIGRPSSPRWEIDIVAFKAPANEVLAVECKSYLDSTGVKMSGFDGSDASLASRFKLFNERRTRGVVLRRLAKQMAREGLCPPDPQTRLALAVGKFRNRQDHAAIRQHFEAQGWALFDKDWIRERLESVSAGRYENQITAVVAKLLLRD